MSFSVNEAGMRYKLMPSFPMPKNNFLGIFLVNSCWKSAQHNKRGEKQQSQETSGGGRGVPTKAAPRRTFTTNSVDPKYSRLRTTLMYVSSGSCVLLIWWRWKMSFSQSAGSLVPACRCGAGTYSYSMLDKKPTLWLHKEEWKGGRGRGRKKQTDRETERQRDRETERHRQREKRREEGKKKKKKGGGGGGGHGTQNKAVGQ